MPCAPCSSPPGPACAAPPSTGCSASPHPAGAGGAAGGMPWPLVSALRCSPPMLALRRLRGFIEAYSPCMADTVSRSCCAAGGGEGEGAAAVNVAVVLHLATGLAVLEAVRVARAWHRARRRALLRAARERRTEAAVSPPEGSPPAGAAPLRPPPAAEHRIATYWRLVEAAVVGGTRKPPCPPVQLQDVLQRAVAHPLAGTSAADGGGKDAIFTLPTPFAFCGEAATVAAAADAEGGSGAGGRWLALYWLWTDSVRYTVNTTEIRGLLLSYPQSSYGTLEAGHETAVAVAAANLAVVWRLTLLRRLYSSLVVHGDTQGCEDEWEELHEHQRAIYQRCIAPWRDGDAGASHHSSCDGLVFSPQRAWAQMSLTTQSLQRFSRRLTLRSVGSLFRYMYASSRSKFLAAAMLAGLTAVSSRVTAAGMRAREAVARLLSDRFAPAAPQPCGGGDGLSAAEAVPLPPADAFVSQVLSLCVFEVIRLTTNAVLLTTSKQFISATASQRRDAVKAQLYEALTHIPLEFYDRHSYDDIEEIVYYVNDLEGVDVHVHQHLFTTATSFIATRMAFRQLAREAQLLVVGTVAATYAVHWAGAVVGHRYRQLQRQQQQHHHSGAAATALSVLFISSDAVDPPVDYERETGGGGATDSSGDATPSPGQGAVVGGDAQEGENVSSAHCRDGIMLRGLEIIAALPQLRPYGADVSMMEWWNGYVTRRTYGATTGEGGAKGGGGVVQLLVDPLLRNTQGQLLPAVGNAVLSLVDWFLPLFTSVYGAYGAGAATAAGRMIDATNSLKAAVEAALDVRRVVEVVLHNGYKAGAIERVLSPKNWENTAAEKIRRMRGYATRHTWDDMPLRPPPVELYRRLSTSAAPDTSQLRAAEATAHSKTPYRDLVVTHIALRGLRFAYPSNPTVGVFPRPFSCDIQLQHVETGRGRLVCITGPSGQGKSTLLHLLLGLYTGYTGAGGDAPITVSLAYKGPPSVAAGDGAGAGEERYSVDLRQIPCNVLREQLFSYVPQYPTLFAGATLAHNITLAPFVSIEQTALLARARACAEAAHCNYIQRFPQGLLTPVGDASSLWSGAGGSNPMDGGLVRLSGGQSQRLMLARALYHGGGVLLMDEPTASLDAATKGELIKQWKELLARGTVRGILCATHDEEVLAAADEVIKLPTSAVGLGMRAV